MKKCKSGYYYCYTDEKCKPIPKGFKVVGRAGYLRKENGHSIDDNENGNGNGNGSGNGGNGNGSGNGGSNGGNGGGGMSEEKKDHEYSMARSQLKTIKNAASRLEKKMGKKGEGELKAWVQSKITKSADYIDTAADYMTNEGTLHKWFKGSKSKDGKGGWVNVVTGGTCASDEPGEGTPKCVSSAKRASMTKAERKSAARRKKAADPGQQQKSGAAKPTYVSTDKKKMKKEEVEIIEGKDKKGKGSGTKDACYHKVKSRYSVWPSAYASGSLVKCRKVGAANWGNSTKKESYELSNWRDDFKATEYEFIDLIKPEPLKGGQEQIEEGQKCWKGYEKKGTKKMFGKTYNNCVKKEEKESNIGGGNIKKLTAKAVRRVDADVDGDVDTKDMKSSETGEFIPSPSGKKLKPKVRFEQSDWRSELEEKKDPCWDTHKQVGMKKKGGRMVPNCVPKNEETEVQEGAAWTKKSGKNQSGGLNEKGRKSYERENPGSDLKRPSKKVGNPRRKSFCARMKGMKKKLTSKKTANDPDSRINKSLRAWNC